MKKFVVLCSIFFGVFAIACPEGTHAETKTKSDYVCNPVTEHKCEYKTEWDHTTGEYKTDWVCGYVTETKCDWVTSTYEECVADATPWPSDPYPDFTPSPKPATLDSLRVGDVVKTLRTTNLQVQTTILTRLPYGAILDVEKIDQSGWFWTEIRKDGVTLKGWVRIRDVTITK